METISSKDSITSKNYIAFFDLDRTITKAISGKAMVRRAYSRGLMTPYQLINAVYLSLVYKLNIKDPSKIINGMARWTKGISEKTMEALCSEVFHELMLPSVYPAARAEIENHKKKDAKVVLLSSAITPICHEVSINLHMDDIICSDLEVKNGYLTGLPRGRICFGEEKLIRLREYCEINNTGTSEAWYYGDSISDLPALSIVGNPVCVNPDNKLTKEALKRGWKILFWN